MLPEPVTEATGLSAEEIAALEPNPAWNDLGLFSEDSLRVIESATTDRPAITYAFGDDPTGTPVFVPDGGTPIGSGAMYWHVPETWTRPAAGWGSDMAFTETTASQLQPGDVFLLLWMEMDSDYDFASARQVNEGFPLALPGLPVWNSSFAGDTWEGANVIPNAIYDNGVLTLDVKRYEPPQSFPVIDLPAFYYRSGNILAMGVSADGLLALANGDTDVSAGDSGVPQTLLFTGDSASELAHEFESALDELLFELYWYGWTHITENGQFTPGFIAYMIEMYGPLETFMALDTVVRWFGPPPDAPASEEDDQTPAATPETETPTDEDAGDTATEPEDDGQTDAPTEPTTVSIADDDGGGGSGLLVIGLVVGALLLIFGARLWFSPGGTRTRDPEGEGTKERDNGDDEEDDGEDVRDVPVAVYGEVPEEEEHVCDWELWVVNETPVPKRTKFSTLEQEVSRAEQQEDWGIEDLVYIYDDDLEVRTEKNAAGDGEIRVVRTRVRAATEGDPCCSAEIRIKTRIRKKTPLVFEHGRIIDTTFTESSIRRQQQFLSRDRRLKAGNNAEYLVREFEDLADVTHVGLNSWSTSSTTNKGEFGDLDVADYAQKLKEITGGKWDFVPPPPEGAVTTPGEPDELRGLTPDSSDVLTAAADALKATVGDIPKKKQAILSTFLSEDTDIEIRYHLQCPTRDARVQRTNVRYGGQVTRQVENECVEHGFGECRQILEAGAWAAGEVTVQGTTVDSSTPRGTGSQLGSGKDTPLTKNDVITFLTEAIKTWADLKGWKLVALPVGKKADQSAFHNKKTPEIEAITGADRPVDEDNSVVVTWTSELATAVKAMLDDDEGSVGMGTGPRNASATARTEVFLNIEATPIKDRSHPGRKCGSETCRGTTCRCGISFVLDFPRSTDFTDDPDGESTRPHHQADDLAEYSALLVVEGKRYYLDRPIHDSGTRYWSLQQY